MKLEGVYSVLPTAFTAAGDLDDASLRRVVDLFIGAGVDYELSQGIVRASCAELSAAGCAGTIYVACRTQTK